MGNTIIPARDKQAVTPVKDQQTVTPEGELVARRIKGLDIRYNTPVQDERGEIMEIFSELWKFHPAPVSYVYQSSMHPGVIKGWIVHKKQEDRIFVNFGYVRWAFYDDREDSGTRGLLNVFTFSERNRALFVIPRGVYHAVQNIGPTEASFINLPSRPYDHADPDKYRLPLKNDLIPFDFSDRPLG